MTHTNQKSPKECAKIFNQPIGILGGTFDPIHYGHLRSALEVQQQLDLQEIRFIPCQYPVHKSSVVASAAHRLAMLKQAIINQPNFCIDERELTRATPSYMIDTLISLKKDFPTQPLCLLIGHDAFANFTQWHRWTELINFSHLIVLDRPDSSSVIDNKLQNFVANHLTVDISAIRESTAGQILFFNNTLLQISSRNIRQQITKCYNPQYLLPDTVYEYIKEHNLYNNS